MDRNIKSATLRPLIILEHLYLETNKDNPVTYEQLMDVLESYGFEVTHRTVYGWVKKFINEMNYPIKVVRMEQIGAPHGLYWED